MEGQRLLDQLLRHFAEHAELLQGLLSGQDPCDLLPRFQNVLRRELFLAQVADGLQDGSAPQQIFPQKLLLRFKSRLCEIYDWHVKSRSHPEGLRQLSEAMTKAVFLCSAQAGLRPLLHGLFQTRRRITLSALAPHPTLLSAATQCYKQVPAESEASPPQSRLASQLKELVRNLLASKYDVLQLDSDSFASLQYRAATERLSTQLEQKLIDRNRTQQKTISAFLATQAKLRVKRKTHRVLVFKTQASEPDAVAQPEPQTKRQTLLRRRIIINKKQLSLSKKSQTIEQEECRVPGTTKAALRSQKKQFQEPVLPSRKLNLSMLLDKEDKLICRGKEQATRRLPRREARAQSGVCGLEVRGKEVAYSKPFDIERLMAGRQHLLSEQDRQRICRLLMSIKC